MHDFECRLIESQVKTNATIHASCFISDEDLILIIGGDKQQILVYRSKKTGADPSDLDDKCKMYK